MNVSEIKSEIESKLSCDAAAYWHNTTEQNDYIVLAQREGVDAAVASIEQDVKVEEDA